MRLTRSQKIIPYCLGEAGRKEAIEGALDLSEMTSIPEIRAELMELARKLFRMSEVRYEALYRRECSEYPKKYVRDYEDDPEDYEEELWR